MNPQDRDAAVRNARHAHEYFTIAKAAARTVSATIARAEHCAELAFTWSRRRPGYRDAAIAADGLLVVIVNAREAGLGRRGVVVSIEHEIDPRTVALSHTAGRAFLRDAIGRGARRAALALDRALAPAEQLELLPVAELAGCVP